jgi:hypothetical protein
MNLDFSCQSIGREQMANWLTSCAYVTRRGSMDQMELQVYNNISCYLYITVNYKVPKSHV